MLGITARFSLPYNPNGKSRQERWYGTLHDQFDKTFTTYTGGNTVDKPESLARVLKQRRNVPTFEEVRDRLGDYIKGYNADADHSRQDMKGLSPNEALEQWCPRRKVMADDNALNLLLQHWAQPVSVGRNGVRVALLGKGFSYGQFNDALRAYKGTKKKVLIAYDPHDIRQVRVFDIKGRYLTTARMNELGGMSTSNPIGRKQVGELEANKRRYRKSRRDVAANGHYAYLSDAELLAHMPPDKPAQPQRERPMKIVRTPLDGQAKYVEDDQFRQAAGAEHDNKPKPRFEYKRDGGLASPTELFSGINFYQRPAEADPEIDMLDLLRSYSRDRFADDDGGDDGEAEPHETKGGDN